MRAGAAAVAMLALVAGPAFAGPDDQPAPPPAVSPSIDLQPVQLVFAAADTTDDLLIAATGAAQTRAGAAAKCFAKTSGDVTGVALVTVDKKGKTSKLLVGGTGDAKLDRCLEKALKPTAWPGTSRGGAIVVTITAGQAPQPADSMDGLVEPGFTTTTGKKDDSGALARVSTSGTIDLGTATIAASTSYRDSVTPRVSAKMSALRSCYTNALKTNPQLHGASSLTITIGGDGKAIAVSVAATGSSDLDTCLTRTLKTLSFPAPPDGNAVDLFIPLTLTAQ